MYKNIKRIFLLFIFFITTLAIRAQFGYGVKVGAGVATLHTTLFDKFYSVSPSWHAGAFATYTIDNSFLVQSTLLYITKGYREYVREGSFSYNDYFRVNYLELTPLQFFFTPKVKKGNLLLGIGPYVGYGLGGKWKQKGLTDLIDDTKGKLIFENDLKNYNGDITVGLYGKKLDWGGVLSLGYKFKNRCSVTIDGGGSLVNIAPKVYGKKPTYTDRNIGMNLSFQYHIK